MSRSAVTMRLSSSKTRAGALTFCALARASSQHFMSALSSVLSSATFLPSAEVLTIMPKFFGFILPRSCRRRVRSSPDFIFWETEILSQKGIRTRYRPVREISVVSRGPFDDMGSLTICTSSSCPGESTSAIAPCLSISGRRFFF